MEKTLEINTTGWNEIHCDKCNQVTSFCPSVKPEDMKCMGCMPVTTPEEFDRLVKEGKI